MGSLALTLISWRTTVGFRANVVPPDLGMSIFGVRWGPMPGSVVRLVPLQENPANLHIMRGRAFIFAGVAAGEDMAIHKSRLHRLVKRLDAPRLAALSARGRAGANALWSQRRAAAEPAGVQVLEAVVVPGPSRAEVLEEEEGVEENVGVLEVSSSMGSVAEGLIEEGLAGKELTEEELVGEELAEEESMEEVVRVLMTTVPLASVEQGGRVPRTVEEWDEGDGGREKRK
ncbi:predicted protein [Histoplasma mississippiense (nom. inval.)]|uniref:predicted protein n=1 Tax=Ajellomyces capsulatus (strain NAm1 / WU24) TaxID=2059318 RepID=UPI000157CADF|nr:predicted protein [Histoplasma mississippiense (nom. inval.)]EDN09134.1 predicted protein [Histoplasma mississippiense (nom. inval.)]